MAHQSNRGRHSIAGVSRKSGLLNEKQNKTKKSDVYFHKLACGAKRRPSDSREATGDGPHVPGDLGRAKKTPASFSRLSKTREISRRLQLKLVK